MPKQEPQEQEQKDISWIDLKTTTQYAGFAHDIYTRQLLRQGKLDHPIAPRKEQHKGYWKWLIAKVSVDHYLASRKVRTGMRRFILKVDLDNLEVVRSALLATGVEFTLELSFKKKKTAKS